MYGDGLTCERIWDAQLARINCTHGAHRLEGIHGSIQEWHMRQLSLQVTKYYYIA